MNASKKIIILSFYRLLSNKNLDKITIEDILKESEVSRSTFYRYFEDKYDLMAWCYKYKVNSILNQTANLGFKEVFYQIYVFIKSEQTYFRKPIHEDHEHSFYRFFLNYSIEYYTKIFLSIYKKEKISENEKYLITYMANGQVSIVIQWIKDGCKKNPSELSEFIFHLMPDTFKVNLPKTLNINY